MLLIAPSVCVLHWLVVLICGKMNYGGTKATDEGTVSRYNLHANALQASQPYRSLDEEVSKAGPRWSGRTSMAPFITDLPKRLQAPNSSTGTANAVEANVLEVVRL